MKLIPHLKQYRNLVAVTHDIVMAGLSFVLSLYLRLGDEFWTLTKPYLLQGTLAFTGICAFFFLRMRLYKGIWRYASLSDLLAITKAALLSIAVFLPLLFLMTRLEGYPRSALVINGVLLIMMLGAPRLIYRLVRDRGLQFDLSKLSDDRVPVLLVGADDLAELFIRNSLHKDELPYRVVGIVANDPRSVGRNLHGIRVHATVDELEKVVTKLARNDRRPHKIILADDSLTGQQVRDILSFAEKRGMNMARLPKLTDLRAASEEGLQLAPIAIEDLLGRPQAALDLKQITSFLKGKRVLVTGAGGAIGGELVRQIIGFEPAEVMLLDVSEYSLYCIDREVGELQPDVQKRAILGDVRHAGSMKRLFKEVSPDIIFHAAAVKHVPIAEANPVETVRTNIIGTVNVAEAARESGAEAMVLISTDKAVNPANLMGASKRFSELYCQALAMDEAASKQGTAFMTVRFGNVLGSAGSVVPLFKHQLERGGPLTVTHPQMERYFMTVREAVELVIQAASAGIQEEHKGEAIYVLDMGEPVKIMDLAEQMIRLAGYRPFRDIDIQITELRPGEKLYEELFYADESPVPTAHPSIMLASPRQLSMSIMKQRLQQLEKAVEQGQISVLTAVIGEAVPEYNDYGTHSVAKLVAG